MNQPGKPIPHSEDDESCLCGCRNEAPIDDDLDAAAWMPPVDEYRLSTRRR